MSRDTIASHRSWTERLRLPFPLLHDHDRAAARALGLYRTIGVGSWSVELFRRSTVLVDDEGLIAALWANVKIRGHATEVLAAGRALRRAGGGPLNRPGEPGP